MSGTQWRWYSHCKAPGCYHRAAEDTSKAVRLAIRLHKRETRHRMEAPFKATQPALPIEVS